MVEVQVGGGSELGWSEDTDNCNDIQIQILRQREREKKQQGIRTYMPARVRPVKSPRLNATNKNGMNRSLKNRASLEQFSVL